MNCKPLPVLGAALTLLLAACGGGGGGGSAAPQPAANQPPTADAGSDVTQLIQPSPITLDGSASSDPENGALDFQWQVSEQPAESDVELSQPTEAMTEFQPAVTGEYVFELTVTDPDGLSSTDTVRVTLTNNPPSASVAAFDHNPVLGTAVTIDASASSDPDGHALSFAWRLTDRPAASRMPPSYEGPTLSLLFDHHGTFVLELEVSDGYDAAVVTLDPIEVVPYTEFELAHGATDAVFDPIRERIVAVDGAFLAIIRTDGSETVLELPTAGKAVAVSPDGTQAAVAHDAWVSHVDLEAAAVLATHPVPDDLGDVVLDGHGNAYCYPGNDSGEIHIVALSTGTRQQLFQFSGAPARAKLHPSRRKMYEASWHGLEAHLMGPEGIRPYYEFSYSRPHDNPCGDLWFGVNGQALLTKCRRVFRATVDRDNDRVPLMRIDGRGQIQHASASPFNRQWLVIDRSDGDGSEFVQAHDFETGEGVDRFDLPYADEEAGRRWLAKFVFASQSSNAHYVLGVDEGADPPAHALLVKVDPEFSTANAAPVASVPRFTTARVSNTVSLDASASQDPERARLTYEWTLVSQPQDGDAAPSGMASDTLAFTPAVAGVYEFELRVNDGARTSPSARATVNVYEADATLIHRLTEAVTDAEYSASMHSLVYLSGFDGNLHILDMDDWSERTVALPELARRVGLSPDGTMAAVSHPSLASLVDLQSAALADQQAHSAEDWGDIVLDHDNRAHLIPVRDQWVSIHAIEFDANRSSQQYGPRADSQMRMHPSRNWIYIADRGLSPSDFGKYDLTEFPTIAATGSPYHGDYPIRGDIWISEDGGRLLVAGGASFHASADPNTDMTYAGRLPQHFPVQWADHSAESDEWAVVTNDFGNDFGEVSKLAFYTGRHLNEVSMHDLAGIPTSHSGGAGTSAARIFHTQDGSQVILVLQANQLLNSFVSKSLAVDLDSSRGRDALASI